MYGSRYRSTRIRRATLAKKGLKTGSGLNSVHYKEIQDLWTQVERHVKGKNEDNIWKAHDRTEEYMIDMKLDVHRSKHIEIMSQFEYMVDSDLGCISIENSACN